MKTTVLGHTGERVSSLCLGCMYLGSSIDEDQSFKLLDLYLDAGGTFLDTANVYAYWVKGCSGGESEATLGRWLTKRKNRQQMFIATKVGAGIPSQIPAGFTRQIIFEQCEQSLKRLRTDYIDLYYAHIDHRDSSLEETLAAFNDLVVQGKVKYIGCSNTLAWRVAEARTICRNRGWAEYCCIQQRHSYLRPKNGLLTFSNGQVPVNADLIDYTSEAADLTIVAYSALLGGVYTHANHIIPDNYQPEEYDQEDMKQRLQTLQDISNEIQATPNQVVLAWLVQNVPSMIAVVSSSSLERLKENINATRVNLSPEQIKRLNQS